MIRRLLRREPIFKAHRLHAYQHLSRRWGHQRVTLTTIAVNVVVLLPLAWLAGQYPSYGVWLAAAVYLALIGVLSAAGAGSRERTPA